MRRRTADAFSGGPDDGENMSGGSPTVAAVQLSIDDLAVERNTDRLRERVDDLPARVDMAVCPEYTITGFVDDGRIREVALDRSDALDRLTSIAAANDVALVAGYVERGRGNGPQPEDDPEGGRESDNGSGSGVGSGGEPGESKDDAMEYYNATAYVPAPGSGGQEPTVYRKRHLWGGERELLTPGTDRVVVETPAGPTGILTCYDLNFVAESAWFTERAVDALFVPGAWPAAHAANWRLLLRARALDGVRWVVGAGRTGGSGSPTSRAERLEYAGNSLVARPSGRVAAALGHEERDLVVTLDRDVLDRQRDLIGSVAHTRDR